MRLMLTVMGCFLPVLVLAAQTNADLSTAVPSPGAAKAAPLRCRECGGKGALPCPVPAPCRRCGGAGQLPCWACGGTREVMPGPFVDSDGHADPAIALKAVRLDPRPLPFTFVGISSNETGVAFKIYSEGSKTGVVTLPPRAAIPSERWPGYRIIRYEEKHEEVQLKAAKGSEGKPEFRNLDISTLTIQKEGSPAVTLTRGRPALFPDRYLARVTNTFERLGYSVEEGMRISILANQYEVVRVKPAPDQTPEVILKRLDSGREFRLPAIPPAR